ncbi:TreC [Staphylococcus virus vB_SurM-PSU5]|nr:TreC [Staphylococcus virus vB_SurM-PSU5]
MNIKVSYTPNCNRSRLKGILKAVEDNNRRTLRYSESMREEADVYVIQIDDSFENLRKYTKQISEDIPGTIFIVVGDYWEIYYRGEGLGLMSALPLIREV